MFVDTIRKFSASESPGYFLSVDLGKGGNDSGSECLCFQDVCEFLIGMWLFTESFLVNETQDMNKSINVSTLKRAQSRWTKTCFLF